MAVRLAVMAAVALGALAADAQAASVSLVFVAQLDAHADRYALTFEAAAGEANHLSVTQTGDATWSFRDTGAAIAPGANCTATPDGVVTCAVQPPSSFIAFVSVDVRLGDGDDSADLHAGAGHLSLGAGADGALADAGSWDVDGGPGPDAIVATGAANVAAAYFEATGPIAVSLDGLPNDGLAGEGDNVGAGVSSVGGGPFGDVLDAGAAAGPVNLLGNRGDDRLDASAHGGILDGGEGDDVLRGALGHDVLSGGDGDDELFGGAGDDGLSGGHGSDVSDGGPGSDAYNVNEGGQDVVRARDGTRDTVECTSLPRRLEVDAVDRLAGCAPRVTARAPHWAGHTLRFVVGCPRTATERCQGTVRVSDGRRRALGFARFSAGRGDHARIAVALRARPRTRFVSAIFTTHRTRRPPSERTTVWTLRVP